MAARSMTHLNGNVLCAIDVETTGFDPKKHDIIQLGILPLDSEIRPLKSVLPFDMELIPQRPENIDRSASATHRINMAELALRALHPDTVADLLVEWFYRLELPLDKKLVPLACNWPFDRSFVIEWLGADTFNSIFHFHYRDLMQSALFCNDRADFHNEKIPHPKAGLKDLCAQLGVHNEKAHNALPDCVATAECYRRLCLQHML